MGRYDGLIIPRSYSEYINKTDAATLSQALQLGGVLDSAPTEDSVKAVKSGGVFDALAGKQPTLTFDNVPTEDSDNPVKSGGIYDAIENAKSDLQSEIDTKQDTLTFDATPTAGSDNPVKSKGIKTYIDGKIPKIRTGNITASGVAANSWTTVDVVFATDIGTTNYFVELEISEASEGAFVIYSNKTSAGFKCVLYNFYTSAQVINAKYTAVAYDAWL